MSESNPSWITKFLAVVRYEILWNIRKKKFVGMLVVAFALVTLSLSLGHIVSALGGEPVEPSPNFVISSNVGLGGFGFLPLETIVMPFSVVIFWASNWPQRHRIRANGIIYLTILFIFFLSLFILH